MTAPIPMVARKARSVLLPLSAAAALLSMGNCRVESPLGTEPPSGAGGMGGPSSSTNLSHQPTSFVNGNGSYSCAASTADVYADCPADPATIVHNTTCTQPTGTVCDYQRSDGWQSCSCQPTSDGNRWYCYSKGIGYDCPPTQPGNGSSCGDADFGRICGYLRPLACTCPADRLAPTR